MNRDIINTKFYLAYGSNLNIRQMAARCPNAAVFGIATLKDYRLLFRGSKTGAYLTVEPCLGASVPVGVYRISARDERALDSYEGYPNFYQKQMLPVEIDDVSNGERITANAMIYIMRGDRPFGLPSQSYLAVCGEGYLDWGFDLEELNTALSYTRREVESA